MKCPNCGNEAQDDAIFCDQCGTRLQGQAAVAPEAVAQTATQPAAQPVAHAAPRGSVCPQCGAVNTPGEICCGECGTPLDAPEPDADVADEATFAGAPVVDEMDTAASSTGAPAGRTCPDCGATVAEDDEFCYACGAELKTAAAAMQPAVEGVPVAGPVEVGGGEPETVEPEAAEPEAVEAVPEPQVEAAPVAHGLTECPTCGARVGPDDAFCEFCGAALIAPTEAAPAAQPEPAAPEIPAAPVTPPQAAPAPAPEPTVAPEPAAPERAVAAPVARLIVTASGVEIPLPQGQEAIVGREDPYGGIFPDIDLTPHGAEEGGVSRRHFRIALSGGQYTVEDLNSTNFTLLNRKRLDPGVPQPLTDGDEIRAGRLRLVFKVGV